MVKILPLKSKTTFFMAQFQPPESTFINDTLNAFMNTQVRR